MAETTTTNYSFKKKALGHPLRDTYTAPNLDLIDAAIKAREASIDALEALADGKIMVGSASGVAVDVAMSGDVTILNTGATAIGANKVTIPKVEASLQKGIITLPLSFETDEQTATKIFFPFKVTINKIRSIVMKALAGTDTGTITGANSTGDSNNGVVTVAISAALNDEDSTSPDTNNVVLADGYYKLTSAKATAGGKALVTLEYTRTA